jgi:hypothetical protein
MYLAGYMTDYRLTFQGLGLTNLSDGTVFSYDDLGI